MTGYAKLKSSIVTSTIWRESPSVCKVWITMLALANKHGEVEGSIPGLADMARLSIEETEFALQKFLAPDPYSRSKEFEGRRIQEIDGGWLILNYRKHRRFMSDEDRRESDRIRQQRHRDRLRQSRDDRDNSRDITQAKAEAKADPEKISTSSAKNASEIEISNSSSSNHPNKKELAAAERELLDKSFAAIWGIYPRKDSGKAKTREKYESAVRATMNGSMRDQCLLVYNRIKAQVEIWEEDGKERKFIPMLSTYLNQRRFDEAPESLVDDAN